MMHVNRTPHHPLGAHCGGGARTVLHRPGLFGFVTSLPADSLKVVRQIIDSSSCLAAIYRRDRKTSFVELPPVTGWSDAPPEQPRSGAAPPSMTKSTMIAFENA